MIFSPRDDPAYFFVWIVVGDIADNIVLRKFSGKTFVGKLNAVCVDINNCLRQVFFQPIENVKKVLIDCRLAAGQFESAKLNIFLNKLQVASDLVPGHVHSRCFFMVRAHDAVLIAQVAGLNLH